MDAQMRIAIEAVFTQNVLFGSESGNRPNNFMVNPTPLIENLTIMMHRDSASYVAMNMDNAKRLLNLHVSQETLTRCKFLECEQNPLLDKFGISKTDFKGREFSGLLALLGLDVAPMIQTFNEQMDILAELRGIHNKENVSLVFGDGVVFVLLELAIKLFDGRQRSLSGYCICCLNKFLMPEFNVKCFVGSTANEAMTCLVTIFQSITPKQAKLFLSV